MRYVVFVCLARDALTLWANGLTLWSGGCVFVWSGVYGM